MPENEKENKDNIELRSEEVQEILTKPPAWIVRWGITLIFLFTLIILVLAFMIKYPDFVTAKVIVSTEQPTERIVARFSGALDDIYISNGDTVRVGQKLAVIRNTANINDVYYLKSIVDTLSIRSENLEFPLDTVSKLELGDIESAYIGFEKNYVDLQLMEDLNPYLNELDGTRQSLVEIKSRLKNQIDQRRLLEQEYALEQMDFDRHQQLYEKGVISQQEYESKYDH